MFAQRTACTYNYKIPRSCSGGTVYVQDVNSFKIFYIYNFYMYVSTIFEIYFFVPE